MNADAGIVLIVDDERAIRMSLRTILSNFGFGIVEAARGEEGLALVRSAIFDAVLLDINMPGMGGIDVCRLMRKSAPRLPIIMLTVQGSEDRKVEALEAGADDYIIKPFRLRELTARLRAAIRRSHIQDAMDPEAIEIEGLMLDPGRHRVEKNGKEIHLTPKQFDLLHYLMAHAGKPIPHAKLLKSVWGIEYGNELEYLRTFIRQIRIKIEDNPAHPKYLLTDSHIGYRFSESAH